MFNNTKTYVIDIDRVDIDVTYMTNRLRARTGIENDFNICLVFDGEILIQNASINEYDINGNSKILFFHYRITPFNVEHLDCFYDDDVEDISDDSDDGKFILGSIKK